VIETKVRYRNYLNSPLNIQQALF